jgi:hypothetical protein
MNNERDNSKYLHREDTKRPLAEDYQGPGSKMFEWAKESYGKKVYNYLVKHYSTETRKPSQGIDSFFWECLKKARGSVLFEGVKPFILGRLKTNCKVNK